MNFILIVFPYSRRTSVALQLSITLRKDLESILELRPVDIPLFP